MSGYAYPNNFSGDKAQFYRDKCGNFETSMEEIEDQKEEQEEKGFGMKGVAKALAILYVLAIYFVIFLKIVFLE
jgi:hypothetical protein